MEEIIKVILSQITVSRILFLGSIFLAWRTYVWTEKEIKERKKEYVSLFEIADRIYASRKKHKSSSGKLVRNRECLRDLRLWKRTHAHIFSHATVEAFFGLCDALAANAGGTQSDGGAYTDEQLEKIEERKTSFADCLRNDTDIWYAFARKIFGYAIDVKKRIAKNAKPRP